LTLYDADGTAIDPRDPSAGPYSPRATCGKCHAYATIASGLHFSGSLEDGPAGRIGEPWILVDSATGTQLPLSDRGWDGTFAFGAIGLSRWDRVTRFGRHLPGGGACEPAPADLAGEAEARRWGVSGGLTIDCMGCHCDDGRHDAAEASRQIPRENFRWIPTAALALAAVRGDARNAPDDWDPLLPPDPDYPERSGPTLAWDRSRFDADDRVVFGITARMDPGRCYFCHTLREVGEGSPEAWTADDDVHLRAGMTCADCHRHGLDHRMVRGYEGEASAASGTLTCRGCHLGAGGGSEGPPDSLGGRLGAPEARHRGLPAVHLEKLACTACHAGPWPTGEVRRFQTARAHGLGVPSKERTAATPPEILGPVYVRGADGRIEPRLLLWPAGFFRIVPAGDATEEGGPAGRLEPVPLDEATRAVRAALPERSAETGEPLGPSEVGRILEWLADGEAARRAEPIYLRGGQTIRRGSDEGVVIEQDGILGPVTWPIAHDVRPSARSLGVAGCTDCHASDAPFTFGRIAPAPGAQTEHAPLGRMYELQGGDASLLGAWARAFAGRAVFKIVGFLCSGVLAAVLLVYGLRGLGSLFGRLR